LPLTNELASPTEYAVPVTELLWAAKEMRAAGVIELAVYHSHPSSAPVPSRRDIERNGYGDAVVHVIIGLGGEAPDVRAWWLTGAGVLPAEWAVG
jgi:proteasome lid subunit RPN8/RPN11